MFSDRLISDTNAVGQPTNVKRFSDLTGTQLVAETSHTFDKLISDVTKAHIEYSDPPDDNGHIVPSELGGETRVYNFFSQNLSINRGGYRDFGSDVREYLDELQTTCILFQKATVDLEVGLQHTGTGAIQGFPLRPDRIQVIASFSDGKKCKVGLAMFMVSSQTESRVLRIIEFHYKQNNMSSNIDKWQELIARIEIDKETSTATAHKLQEFESHVGIQLPLGYKEFCQTFGRGEFTKTEFGIDCPSVEDLDILLMSDREMIEACKNAYKQFGSPTNIMELLDNAYVFGSGQGYVLFFFDLRTYNEEDKSYDIWGVGEPISEDLAIYNLGRDFYNFICDICLDWSNESLYLGIYAGISRNARVKYQNASTKFMVAS